MTVDEYESQWREQIRPVAQRWSEIWQKEYEKKVREYERKEGEELRRRQIIQNLTKNELTELCKSLLQKGIITSPEQFPIVVRQRR